MKKNVSDKQLKKKSILISKNPQFDIKIIEIFVAGIVLSGNEIKSLRSRNVSIRESYITSKNREIFIFNMYIAPYKNANLSINKEFDGRLKRKLLMKKSEIKKIFKYLKEKSCIIFPLKIFINERGWAKIEIAISQKLKKYQIKSELKEKEIKRKIQKRDFF